VWPKLLGCHAHLTGKKADEQFFSKKRQKKCGEEIMTDKNSAIDNN